MITLSCDLIERDLGQDVVYARKDSNLCKNLEVSITRALIKSEIELITLSTLTESGIFAKNERSEFIFEYKRLASLVQNESYPLCYELRTDLRQKLNTLDGLLLLQIVAYREGTITYVSNLLKQGLLSPLLSIYELAREQNSIDGQLIFIELKDGKIKFINNIENTRVEFDDPEKLAKLISEALEPFLNSLT